MYSMSVISLQNKEKTRLIYDEFKKYIPNELKCKEEYQYDEKKEQIHIPIPRESEEFILLEKIARENHIAVFEYEFTDYTKAEIKKAQFFQMFVSDPLESEGKYAKDYGTEYIDCCDVCKIDGKLVGDVLVRLYS